VTSGMAAVQGKGELRVAGRSRICYWWDKITRVELACKAPAAVEQGGATRPPAAQGVDAAAASNPRTTAAAGPSPVKFVHERLLRLDRSDHASAGLNRATIAAKTVRHWSREHAPRLSGFARESHSLPRRTGVIDAAESRRVPTCTD
jgi:hypothetical protein